MRKRLLTMLTALLSAGLYAQVGINTEDPKASLDIVANTATPTANGLLVPRLTATEVQTMETQVGDDQNALLVYVTATFTIAPTDARYTDIDAIGYYYYDAKDNAPKGKWKKLGNGGGNYTAGAGIQIGSGTISATGLERSVVIGTNTIYHNDNDFYAWSLIGRDKQIGKSSYDGKPKYLPLGIGAVDLSHGQESQTQSPTGASGRFSFASGLKTIASGEWSTAMGYGTIASAHNSTAMGDGTIASGANSTAMGERTKARGYRSTAMGLLTTASGFASTAMGSQTNASGSESTAMGARTTAPYNFSTAMGVYNVTPTGALLMVGNGEWNGGNPIRQNALTIYKNGDIEAKKIYTTDGSTATKVVVVDPDGKLQSIDKNSFAYNAGAGIEMASGTISATGLERRNVRNSTLGIDYYAWSLIGRDKDVRSNSKTPRYLPLGAGAVDLSYAHTVSTRTPTGASGLFSFASGKETTASGLYSTAIGWETIASGLVSTAMGWRTKASGKHSTAMGSYTDASGENSTAMGYATIASGNYSVAMGGELKSLVRSYAKASGINSFAFGNNVEAKADYSIAMGWGGENTNRTTKATGKYAIAMGYGTEAKGEHSVAMGGELDGTTSKPAKALGKSSFAFGRWAEAQEDYSIAMGWGYTATRITKATGKYAIAMGYGTTASGQYSTAIGAWSNASGGSSTAMGERTNASGYRSTAIGLLTNASGFVSTAMGSQTTASGSYSTASGEYSTAMGRSTTASGTSSVAMGGEYDSSTNTIKPAKALGKNSFAFGRWAEARADHSIALGWGESATQLTKATGEYAIAMGYRITASGTSSTAMGRYTIASGSTSVAMGWMAKAIGDFSVAIGDAVQAHGYGSTALGEYSVAQARYSTAMGNHTKANHQSSTAMGEYTETTAPYSLAIGKYNRNEQPYAFVVGVGYDDNNRKNAFCVFDGVKGVGIGKNTYSSSWRLGVNGNINCWNVQQTSDARLKKEIQPLSVSSDVINQLRPVQYYWNEKTVKDLTDKSLQYGFIAQDIEKLFPNLVKTAKDKDGYKSLNYNGLIPVLTKALQEKSAIIDEQQSEIEVLKAELQAEKARNDQQEARLKAIEAKLK